MTGYAARLMARATGAPAADGPPVLRPAFVPRFLPDVPSTEDTGGAASVAVAPPETVLQEERVETSVPPLRMTEGTPPPTTPRAVPAKPDAAARGPDVLERSVDHPVASAGPDAAPPVDLQVEQKALPPARADVPPVATDGPPLPEHAPDPAPPPPRPKVDDALTMAASVPALPIVQDPATPEQEATLVNASEPAPLPKPDGVPLAPAPTAPAGITTQIETPGVSIGRIDVIFEEPTPAAPRTRAAPERTHGFVSYDRARLGQRR